MTQIDLDYGRPDIKSYVALFGLLILASLVGLGCAYYMEHNGHWVTGMNNQVIWGLPHVFAVFLIVAASGALNVASVSSVFSRKIYKPLAPLSTVVSLALLAGGLAVLVLDLGRPDRLIVAMTSYNFKSIFAWNIYLYTGFFVVVLLYLAMMLERRMQPYAKSAGIVAFIWRLALTTGTGSIFGFLVARQGYDAAIMAPMFIVFSLAYGHAVFNLIIMGLYAGRPDALGDLILHRMRNLMRIFIAASAYFVIVHHLTNLYATEHHAFERFILLEGGVMTALFWLGQMGIGYVLPLALLFHPKTKDSRSVIALASVLVILGGLVQMYVTIIGGQAFPLVLFPGMEVSSGFSDGVINDYLPSLYELGLGILGVSLALIIVIVALKVLRIVPSSLQDRFVDPQQGDTGRV